MGTQEVWAAFDSELALQRSLRLLSGGPLGEIRLVGSLDQLAVFLDHPAEVPGALVTGQGFKGVGIGPGLIAHAPAYRTSPALLPTLSRASLRRGKPTDYRTG